MSSTSLCRATLREAVTLPPAIGTLCLRPVTVSLQPAGIGSGLQVRRIDIGQQWPLGLEHLTASTNCTAVGDESGYVAFLEHLLAALAMAAISDVLVTTDGPEIPLYDGSATPLWEALQHAGQAVSGEIWPPLVITQPCQLTQANRSLLAVPAAESCFGYELDHPHPLIGSQSARFCASDDFGTQLAPARTFATAEQIRATRGQEPGREVEAICVIAYDDHLSEVQRLPQPFARHKLLDLVGDLFLCGQRLQGTVSAVRTGHADNHEFLRTVVQAERERQ